MREYLKAAGRKEQWNTLSTEKLIIEENGG
jgi:hypothetical protein